MNILKFSALCLLSTLSINIFANSVLQTPIAPPSGIGLFMYNTIPDMVAAGKQTQTQITKKYPLNPNTTWYLYPAVFTLYCDGNTPYIFFGRPYKKDATTVWSLLTHFYKQNWQPHMSTGHQIYLMPGLSIDPASCGKPGINIDAAAKVVADSINKAPSIDGLMIDDESNPAQPAGKQLIAIINSISKQLLWNKRLAVYSGNHVNVAPSNPISIWPALNRTFGCAQNKPGPGQTCIKGFWSPSIYDSILVAKKQDGAISDFYKQTVYLISQQFYNIVAFLKQSKLGLEAVKNGYYMQPAMPGSSSANNAAAYLTTSDIKQPISLINQPDYWGTDYQASAWQKKEGNSYHHIQQAHPALGDPDPALVQSCQYLCTGLEGYSVLSQILMLTKADNYPSSALWKNIKTNLTHICDIPTNYNAWQQGDDSPIIPPSFVDGIAQAGLQDHLIGMAIYQLKFSPLNAQGEETDWTVHRCNTKTCPGLNPYPSTMTPVSWKLLNTWLTQQEASPSSWGGWLSQTPLNDPSNLSTLLDQSLSCQDQSR